MFVKTWWRVSSLAGHNFYSSPYIFGLIFKAGNSYSIWPSNVIWHYVAAVNVTFDKPNCTQYMSKKSCNYPNAGRSGRIVYLYPRHFFRTGSESTSWSCDYSSACFIVDDVIGIFVFFVNRRFIIAFTLILYYIWKLCLLTVCAECKHDVRD